MSCLALAVGGEIFGSSLAIAQGESYVEKATVAEPTRLDWLYPVLGHSPAKPPVALAGANRLAVRSYEFYGPAIDDRGVAHPLVIFISPSDRPVGWPFWEPTCRERGVLFAGLRDAGNGKSAAERVRAVLDVLDDVRRRFRIDPERTYLAGFSGGAHVACLTAFHLPEYFGGVVCVGHAPEAPRQPWLVRRLRDRLSVAIVCGDHDPGAAFVEDLADPYFRGMGIRTEAVLLRGVGHRMPDAEVFSAAFDWLEVDVDARRNLARRFPAASISDAPSRSQWAGRVLDEAKARLAEDDLVDSGLRQLEWAARRWPDLPQALEAHDILSEYAARTSRPWESQWERESQLSLRLEAEGYSRLAGRNSSAVQGQQGQCARGAISLWEKLRNATHEEALIANINERIAALRIIVESDPAGTKPVKLTRVRFRLVGQVTLAKGIEYLERSLAGLGYRLEIDEPALRAAGIDFDRQCDLQLPNATLDQAAKALLTPSGLKIKRVKNVISIVPSGVMKTGDDPKAPIAKSIPVPNVSK